MKNKILLYILYYIKIILYRLDKKLNRYDFGVETVSFEDARGSYSRIIFRSRDGCNKRVNKCKIIYKICYIIL